MGGGTREGQARAMRRKGRGAEQQGLSIDEVVAELGGEQLDDEEVNYPCDHVPHVNLDQSTIGLRLTWRSVLLYHHTSCSAQPAGQQQKWAVTRGTIWGPNLPASWRNHFGRSRLICMHCLPRWQLSFCCSSASVRQRGTVDFQTVAVQELALLQERLEDEAHTQREWELEQAVDKAFELHHRQMERAQNRYAIASRLGKIMQVSYCPVDLVHALNVLPSNCCMPL